jgi:hypothetical protein
MENFFYFVGLILGLISCYKLPKTLTKGELSQAIYYSILYGSGIVLIKVSYYVQTLRGL